MGNDQTIIRPARLDDLHAVSALFGHYVTTSVVTFEQTPPTIGHWRRLHADLAARSLPFLIGLQSGAVAGYAYATPWRSKPAYRRTVEDSIYVAPDRTGQGWGHRLLEALLTECAAAGVEQVIAVIADSGDAASTALHRAHGFLQAGRLRRVGYKHGRVLDTTLWQCDLTATGSDPASDSRRPPADSGRG